MQIQTKLLADTLTELTGIEPRAEIGALSDKCGFVLQPVSGSQDDVYLSGGCRMHLTIQLLCRDKNRSAFDRVAQALNRLSALKIFVPRSGYQMLHYEPQSGPQFVGYETTGGTAIYTGVVLAYFYVGGTHEANNRP